jgi:hypothetical protein
MGYCVISKQYLLYACVTWYYSFLSCLLYCSKSKKQFPYLKGHLTVLKYHFQWNTILEARILLLKGFCYFGTRAVSTFAGYIFANTAIHCGLTILSELPYHIIPEFTNVVKCLCNG